MKARQRAFSLTEIMVVGGLMLVVLGAISLVFAIGLRYSRQAQVYSHLQQQSALALQRMTRELSNALPEGFSCSPGTLTGSPPAYSDAPYVWFASSELPAPSSVVAAYDQTSGRLQFQKWVCYYLDVEPKELVRCEENFTSGPVTSPLGTVDPLPSLALFRSSSGLKRKVVARDIARLTVTLEAGNSCSVRLTASQYNGSKPCNVEVESDVVFLNT